VIDGDHLLRDNIDQRDTIEDLQDQIKELQDAAADVADQG